MAKKDNEKTEAEGTTAVETADSPLLDLSDAAVKKMIKTAKKRGFVTYRELNAVLPSEEVNSEQIEDILAMLNEMGINVIESEEAEEADSEEEAEEEIEGGELVEITQTKAVATKTSEPADRTDDPVRMYLREMGSVELLSREGEIAIAKRIEAGREAMIAGLCESPLTFQAIIIWRDELNDGKVLLRDIIDLEATYAGPDGKNTPKIDMTAPGAQEALAAQRAPATAPLNPPAGLRPAGDDEAEAPIPEETFDEEDDMENSVSLSAMEAELKPKVLETFDRVADAYKKLNKLQVQNVESKLKNETLTPAQERRYKALKKEIVVDVKSLSLNQNRIDLLVEQLYDINKKLIGLETKLLRLAEESGVAREDFLKNYHNSELDPKWLLRVSKLGGRGWKDFVTRRKDHIRELRSEIHDLSKDTGVETAEFRKIVQIVQKGEREARQAKKEMVEANLR
ncbi:MAG: RNA polymerase sigma factor region1.1 domain-containing protein, partial [Methylovirgula sp.]|nr:RNA polymerase sigma factor region1.1 domain-containing protein [Methylovirgula sp.]